MKTILSAALLLLLGACAPTLRATGDLGLVVERADGRLKMVENTHSTTLAEISGLGDLSHASVVYSRDERFAFVFGRDGGLTKIDMLQARIVGRVMQSGNSIGGAISQDGSLVAVANYTPGGVKVFDSDSLELVADIAAIGADGKSSKVVGLEDAPGNIFAFSLYDAGEIWLLDLKDRSSPKVRKFPHIGNQPYDALITEDGRYYMAGLFGEDGIAMLDLWNPDLGVRRILDHYGRGQEALPVYKMPHLEGWAASGNLAFLPAIGRHEVLVVDMTSWREVGRIAVAGQPVFAMLQPGGRRLWVNFAIPDNGKVQVIDVPSLSVLKTIEPGLAVLHLEFTPRGERVWLSARDSDQVTVWDTETITQVAALPASKPSGIFFTARAHRIGL
ncbi:cytochrome D1 domain-containing protein [Magnetospirillum sulfuroxidans]|uniref:Protein nirF n=1 Tax=Magnetospirillum sulfuroxidans TaxID=611300 RepID=A0ABS5IB21_9PROT|nr:cytochrome D1 domain-containing protein [Magnetospirillum sulfuroxidans]MBR9971621.1 protein nirF [Magnetospirillum sulfuroxidans]